MYKLSKSLLTGQVSCVQKQVGDVLYSIPFDPANTDYQEYLKFLAEGGTPLPAENE